MQSLAKLVWSDFRLPLAESSSSIPLWGHYTHLRIHNLFPCIFSEMYADWDHPDKRSVLPKRFSQLYPMDYIFFKKWSMPTVDVIQQCPVVIKV